MPSEVPTEGSAMEWDNNDEAEEDEADAGPTKDDSGGDSPSAPGDDDDDDEVSEGEDAAVAAEAEAEVEGNAAAEADSDDDDEEDDDDDDDDEEEVVAAVVFDDDDDDDEEDSDDDGDDARNGERTPPAPVAPRPSANVSSSASKAIMSTPPPAKKKAQAPPKSSGGGSNKKPSASSKAGGSAGKTVSSATKATKKAPSKAKGSGAGGSNKSHPGDVVRTGVVSAKSLAAAKDARTLLEEVVQSLPITMEECTVRSFGRLSVNGDPLSENHFCTAGALYPVGFSCDRYEFSPVHGRVLKVNCAILDGSKIRDKQKSMGVPIEKQLKKDGPVFRLMWGPAIDEDATLFEHPYIPQIHSAPITSGPVVLAIADPSSGSNGDNDNNNGRNSSGRAPRVLEPSRGMRVRVRFEKNEWYNGTIAKSKEQPSPPPSSKKKKKPKSYALQIRYDDGSLEDITYPDPDMALLLPGIESEVDALGNVELTDLNGKPVTTVVATSPIEAWGLALVKLGMIDEVMYEFALEQLKKSRLEAFHEAKKRLEGTATAAAAATPQASKSRDAGDVHSVASNQSGMSAAPTPLGDTVQDDSAEAPDAEPPSEREKAFRSMTEDLLQELESAMEEDHEAAIELADARTQLQGPLMCNPFDSDDHSKSQQVSWLATAVRKEKLKMGSTGNRKKLVTSLDLLERNDTLYNTDIEALIEGLPGSEYCNSYVFKAFRGNAVTNRQWMHEAQLRREKEVMRQVNRQRESVEKVHQENEKLKKRKERDDVRDARKRQKLEEEDQKKRARIEERLSRLKVQVDERLHNEAAFQREKVILLLAKNQTREYSRRRKAAETVAAQAIVEAKETVSRRQVEVSTLPSLSKTYEEDTIRVWNFMTTFGSFFMERGYISDVPTLESLQSAIDTIRNGAGLLVSNAEAVSTLTDLAVAVCKPLAASLTRALFASLIALNPTLQKDFGAAFFNEVNATGGVKEDADEATTRADVLLPVNSMTWQEVARLSMLADALGELGFQRHETAHFLRGYRSAGHPNSKEAKRLRKTEDIWVALLRQEIEVGGPESCGVVHANSKLKIEIPCSPLSAVGDFMYYLHSVKSMTDPTCQDVRMGLTAALSIAQGSNHGAAQEQKAKLLQFLSLVDEHAASAKEPKFPRKLRNKFLQVFDKYAGVASSQYADSVAGGVHDQDWPWLEPRSKSVSASCIGPTELRRERMGQLNWLLLSQLDYKELSQFREQFTENALLLKEEEEKKALKEDEDDEDEDDDFDDENEKNETVSAKAQTPGSDSDQREASEEANGDSSKTTVSEKSNGEAGAGASVANEIVRIGKPTEYDEFCGDIPTAPEPLRRCLAVLRALCNASQASSFLNPIDPQSNPGYYDSVLQPMCLREVGTQLYAAAAKSGEPGAHVHSIVEAAVVQFGRNVRLIEQNTLCYGNAGPTVISMGSELLRIFERLFLDWVLAPADLLPPLTDLDDDKCVNPHPSDDESTVLFCDGCEGKYNITRLEPPLAKVPSGDWYCPQCMSGRWWGHLDPRVGKCFTITNLDERIEPSSTGAVSAVVKSCTYRYPEQGDGKASLMYIVEIGSENTEVWSLEKINEALAASGIDVPPVPFLESVAESPGYGHGVDLGLRKELVPTSANPRISESAAQVALSSSVFRDTVAAAGTLLLIDPEDMTAGEWLRLLVLLTTKCSSSDVIQTVVGKMETVAAESMVAPLEKAGKVLNIQDILPDIAGVASELDAIPLESEDALVNGHPEEASSGVADAPSAVTTTETPSSQQVTRENGARHTVVVEAVEVVEDMDVEPTVTLSINDQAPDGAVSATEVVEEVPAYALALLEKKRRRKTVEDSIAAYSIKTQLRPAVASFEEDRVSQVVDATLTANIPGLDFASVRCRRKSCDLCGLLDVALGSPLLRVPNQEEWAELMPHTMRNRRVWLVASTPSKSGASTDSAPPLVALKIRVDGDIFSVPDGELHHIPDGGMLEFAPRANAGFRNELSFRGESDTPFITGSLSAHECCAVAAHNARKELLVQAHRERQAELIEKEAGMRCGRTLEIGHDAFGRSYWKFLNDEGSLFVNAPDASSSTSRVWLRYDGPARIASVMFAVTKDKVFDDLKQAFPEAALLLRNGSWKDVLMAQAYPNALRHAKDEDDDAMDVDNSAVKVLGGLDPYSDGEDVLVEAKSGSMLWDAVITGVSQQKLGPEQEMVIDAYRVEYKGWNSRFTEWVEPKRVVEPNENNRLLQEELNMERGASRGGLPPSLNMLVAKDYFFARDRVRGTAPLPEFDRIAQASEGASSSEVTFGLMKAAILAVEAALPLGSVDNSDDGPWNRRYAQQWRRLVELATGPARLMQCVILLEDMVGEEWINQEVMYLRSCLPARWKAMHEASSASLAVRIILLDRSLKYGSVDRKRYQSNAKKKANRAKNNSKSD